MYIQGKLDWSPSDFFNYHDMNRIENNMQVIVDKIYDKYEKDIVLETVITTRDNTSFDYYSSINRIERNLEKIRRNWIIGNQYMMRGGKQWDVNTPFTYEDAIRWEYNLQILYHFADRDFDSYFKNPCGKFYCGKEKELY